MQIITIFKECKKIKIMNNNNYSNNKWIKKMRVTSKTKGNNKLMMKIKNKINNNNNNKVKVISMNSKGNMRI